MQTGLHEYDDLAADPDQVENRYTDTPDLDDLLVSLERRRETVGFDEFVVAKALH